MVNTDPYEVGDTVEKADGSKWLKMSNRHWARILDESFFEEEATDKEVH
jgi:hypothetical protein